MTNINGDNEMNRNGISIKIYEDKEQASVAVAQRIAELIKSKRENAGKAVLGLATGATPVGVYKELIRMHREEGLSFQNVITFNLDEYYPMQPDSDQSYVSFMHQQLFSHIDIPAENINIPDGTLEEEVVDTYCEAYEQKIANAGGLDIQLLGIGRTGHVGFNEPGSTADSLTRLVTLNEVTRQDAAQAFGDIENVPAQAITMGVGTIAKAKNIILMAWGEKKAEIVKKALEGEITAEVPATFLQELEGVEFVLDKEGAGQIDG